MNLICFCQYCPYWSIWLNKNILKYSKKVKKFILRACSSIYWKNIPAFLIEQLLFDITEQDIEYECGFIEYTTIFCTGRPIKVRRLLFNTQCYMKWQFIIPSEVQEILGFLRRHHIFLPIQALFSRVSKLIVRIDKMKTLFLC